MQRRAQRDGRRGNMFIEDVLCKRHFVPVLLRWSGKPNAGKSTLVNRLVGQKVAIVTSRPQTTRNRILGIVNRPKAQVVLIDTPGIHRADYRARPADDGGGEPGARRN